MTAQRWWLGALVVPLLLACVSCTENDELLVDNIGVTVLLLVDSDLTSQNVDVVDDRLQVAEWTVIPEDPTLGKTQLDIDGALIDPLFGETCLYADTVQISGSAGGACSGGVVIESSTAPYEVTLTLIVDKMQVRRAEPKTIPLPLPVDPGGNVDLDNTLNGADNCPFEPNFSQAETIRPGVGDACLVFDFFRGWVLDSDGDNVADFADNCVWTDNPAQTDTEGLGASGIRDGIGDACKERTIQVFPDQVVGAPQQFKIVKTLQVTQGFQQTLFLVVDFNSKESLHCDWDVFTCELDVDAVKVCTATSLAVASLGCS